MFKKDMKNIIRMAMEYDLSELYVKPGYNGAPLLVIKTNNKEQAKKLVTFIKNVADNAKLTCYNKVYKISAVFGNDIKNYLK